MDKTKVLSLYSVIPNNTLMDMYLLNQLIGRIPYPVNNTGEFPQDFKEAVYEQPLYYTDENLHKETLELYALPYLLLPDFLKIDISQLTCEHVHYLQLFLLKQNFQINSIDIKSIECRRNYQHENNQPASPSIEEKIIIKEC